MTRRWKSKCMGRVELQGEAKETGPFTYSVGPKMEPLLGFLPHDHLFLEQWRLRKSEPGAWLQENLTIILRCDNNLR